HSGGSVTARVAVPVVATALVATAFAVVTMLGSLHPGWASASICTVSVAPTGRVSTRMSSGFDVTMVYVTPGSAVTAVGTKVSGEGSGGWVSSIPRVRGGPEPRTVIV